MFLKVERKTLKLGPLIETFHFFLLCEQTEMGGEEGNML